MIEDINKKPADSWYEVSIGGLVARFGKGFYDTLLTHPVILEEAKKYSHITIDEFAKLSDEQLAYLISEHGAKIVNSYDTPKKQHKPKHKVPYWVKDWRKK